MSRIPEKFRSLIGRYVPFIAYQGMAWSWKAGVSQPEKAASTDERDITEELN
jgi:hypothetical protein